MAGGITNIASVLFVWRYTKEKSVLEGQMLYPGSTSETHSCEFEFVSNNIFHSALQQLTYDILAVRIALRTHTICIQ